ncbi:MAG: NAD(P)-dependent oxidoreductase [Acidobacteriota bacterium]|nr:NAD(P)-dependent oxidoreductase [Acidobacteriota bacterium]
MIPAPTTTEALEAALCRPSEPDVACLRDLPGDILILGAAGKMGPSLARLCRLAADQADTGGPARRVFAAARRPLDIPGVEWIACDLLDRAQVAALPDCPNVLHLTGRKFGSTGDPGLTWAINTLAPALAAERFRASRMVVFSTGNVYEFRRPEDGGSRESDTPAPCGEYAQSCLGRERVFEYFSRRDGLRCLLFRLNYAVDLRYGVPVDIARRVWEGRAVSLAVPAFNAIWQRDANSYGLRALGHCASPPAILNVTGSETITVREAAAFFAARWNRPCRFEGANGTAALLSDASRCRALLGEPEVSGAQLLSMVAAWIESGGASSHKPTHFEVADGKF